METKFTQVTEANHALLIGKYRKDTSSVLIVRSSQSGHRVHWLSDETTIASRTHHIFVVRTDLAKHYGII